MNLWFILINNEVSCISHVRDLKILPTIETGYHTVYLWYLQHVSLNHHISVNMCLNLDPRTAFEASGRVASESSALIQNQCMGTVLKAFQNSLCNLWQVVFVWDRFNYYIHIQISYYLRAHIRKPLKTKWICDSY